MASESRAGSVASSAALHDDSDEAPDEPGLLARFRSLLSFKQEKPGLREDELKFEIQENYGCVRMEPTTTVGTLRGALEEAYLHHFPQLCPTKAYLRHGLLGDQRRYVEDEVRLAHVVKHAPGKTLRFKPASRRRSRSQSSPGPHWTINIHQPPPVYNNSTLSGPPPPGPFLPSQPTFLYPQLFQAQARSSELPPTFLPPRPPPLHSGSQSGEAASQGRLQSHAPAVREHKGAPGLKDTSFRAGASLPKLSAQASALEHHVATSSAVPSKEVAVVFGDRRLFVAARGRVWTLWARLERDWGLGETPALLVEDEDGWWREVDSGEDLGDLGGSTLFVQQRLRGGGGGNHKARKKAKQQTANSGKASSATPSAPTDAPSSPGSDDAGPSTTSQPQHSHSQDSEQSARHRRRREARRRKVVKPQVVQPPRGLAEVTRPGPEDESESSDSDNEAPEKRLRAGRAMERALSSQLSSSVTDVGLAAGEAEEVAAVAKALKDGTAWAARHHRQHVGGHTSGRDLAARQSRGHMRQVMQIAVASLGLLVQEQSRVRWSPELRRTTWVANVQATILTQWMEETGEERASPQASEMARGLAEEWADAQTALIPAAVIPPAPSADQPAPRLLLGPDASSAQSSRDAQPCALPTQLRAPHRKPDVASHGPGRLGLSPSPVDGSEASEEPRHLSPAPDRQRQKSLGPASPAHQNSTASSPADASPPAPVPSPSARSSPPRRQPLSPPVAPTFLRSPRRPTQPERPPLLLPGFDPAAADGLGSLLVAFVADALHKEDFLRWLDRAEAQLPASETERSFDGGCTRHSEHWQRENVQALSALIKEARKAGVGQLSHKVIEDFVAKFTVAEDSTQLRLPLSMKALRLDGDPYISFLVAIEKLTVFGHHPFTSVFVCLNVACERYGRKDSMCSAEEWESVKMGCETGRPRTLGDAVCMSYEEEWADHCRSCGLTATTLHACRVRLSAGYYQVHVDDVGKLDGFFSALRCPTSLDLALFASAAVSEDFQLELRRLWRLRSLVLYLDGFGYATVLALPAGFPAPYALKFGAQAPLFLKEKDVDQLVTSGVQVKDVVRLLGLSSAPGGRDFPSGSVAAPLMLRYEKRQGFAPLYRLDLKLIQSTGNYLKTFQGDVLKTLASETSGRVARVSVVESGAAQPTPLLVEELRSWDGQRMEMVQWCLKPDACERLALPSHMWFLAGPWQTFLVGRAAEATLAELLAEVESGKRAALSKAEALQLAEDVAEGAAALEKARLVFPLCARWIVLRQEDGRLRALIGESWTARPVDPSTGNVQLVSVTPAAGIVGGEFLDYPLLPFENEAHGEDSVLYNGSLVHSVAYLACEMLGLETCAGEGPKDLEELRDFPNIVAELVEERRRLEEEGGAAGGKGGLVAQLGSERLVAQLCRAMDYEPSKRGSVADLLGALRTEPR